MEKNKKAKTISELLTPDETIIWKYERSPIMDYIISSNNAFLANTTSKPLKHLSSYLSF